MEDPAKRRRRSPKWLTHACVLTPSSKPQHSTLFLSRAPMQGQFLRGSLSFWPSFAEKLKANLFLLASHLHWYICIFLCFTLQMRLAELLQKHKKWEFMSWKILNWTIILHCPISGLPSGQKRSLLICQMPLISAVAFLYHIPSSVPGPQWPTWWKRVEVQNPIIVVELCPPANLEVRIAPASCIC